MENSEVVKNQEVIKKDTYLCLKNEKSLIEIDLVTFREKGEQTKFLSVGILAKNEKTGEGQEVGISLDEESFLTLKEFFKQLEWNS